MRTVIVAVCLILATAPAIGSPSSVEALERLAEKASPQAALKQVEAFLAEHPGEYDALLLKGYLLSQLGRNGGAEKIYRSLIRKHPKNPEPYNNLAVLYASAGQYEKAAETLKQALGTHPSYSIAYENLGRVYGRSASEAYSRALGVEPPKESDGEGLVMLKLSPNGAADQAPAGQKAQAEAPSRLPLPPTPRASDSTVERRRTARDSVGPPPPRSSNPQQEVVSTSAPRAPSQQPAADLRDEINSTVRSWARAWSEQQVDAYLNFYSQSFRPPENLSRSTWEAERRARIQRPRTIRVVVRNLQPPVTTARGTAVTFVQSYSSDRFADKVTKILVFIRENGEWKILEERSAS